MAYKYDFYEAHNNLGVANRKLGQISIAAKNFEKAIEINPSYILALLNLGVVLKDLEQKVEAAKFFKRVIAIEPDNLLAQKNLKELSSD